MSAIAATVATILDLPYPPGTLQSCLCLLVNCPIQYWAMANYLLFGPAFLVCDIRRPNSSPPDRVRSWLSFASPSPYAAFNSLRNTWIDCESITLNLLLFYSMNSVHPANGVWTSCSSQAVIVFWLDSARTHDINANIASNEIFC